MSKRNEIRQLDARVIVEDEHFPHEKLLRNLRSIASKPEISKIMAEYGMAKDPFPKTNGITENPIEVPNTLYEHFGFLLKSGVVPPKITLRVISKPKWFRLSLELRRDGSSQPLSWVLTDHGRLMKEYFAPSLYGKTFYLVQNKIVDLFKESVLSNRILSLVTASFLVLVSLTRLQHLWHGEHFLLNSSLVIVGFFGACGFMFNLYPEHLIDPKAQESTAAGLLFFLALWALTALGYGFLGAIRTIAFH